MTQIYIALNNNMIAYKLKESLEELLLEYNSNEEIPKIKIIVEENLDLNFKANNTSILIIEEEILNEQFDFIKNNIQNIILITDNLYISDNCNFDKMIISYKPLSLKHLTDQIINIIKKHNNKITVNDVTLVMDINKAFLYQNHNNHNFLSVNEIDETLNDNNSNYCPLSNIEAKIIYLLLSNYPDCVSKEFLLQKIWEISNDIETKTLESHIHNTRNKIAAYNIKLSIDKIKEGFIISFSPKTKSTS